MRLIILVLLAGLGACSGGDDSGGEPGTEGAVCYPNGTCNTGLTCLSDRCVALPNEPDGAVLDGAVLDGAVLDGAVLDGAVLDGGSDAAPAPGDGSVDAGAPDAGLFDANLTDACIPTTCGAEAAGCGIIPDGCGGALSCGTCASPDTCAGAGTANVCGCTATTCALEGVNCGSIDNGCGATLSCGTCGANATCGLAGTCNCNAGYTGDGFSCAWSSNALSFASGQSLSSAAPLGMGAQSTVTAEFWVKFTSLSTTQDLMNIHNASNQDLYVEVQGNQVFCNFLTQPAVSYSGLVIDTWYHIACSKTGSTLRIFVNGDLKDSGAWTGSPLLDDYMTVSGFEGKWLTGVLDEVKLSTNAYTANFTPSEHLASDANTVLLWHLDEGTGTTSADLSGNGRTAVLGMLGAAPVGLPTWVISDRLCGTGGVVCCSPTTCAAEGAECGTLADGCSGTLNCGTCSAPETCAGAGEANVCGCNPYYGLDFDGADDGLSSANLSLGLSTGFTAEYWLYPTAIGPWMKLLNIHNASNRDVDMELRPDGRVYCSLFDQAGGNHGSTSSSVLVANNWYHVACTYDGTTQRMFINGVLETQTSWAGQVQLNDQVTISGFESRFVNAIIDEFRLSSSAKYTTTFTPMASFPVAADTILLWLFDDGSGAASLDSSGNGLTANLGTGPNVGGPPAWIFLGCFL